MKKIVVLLLAVVMMFTAVACAEGNKKPSNETGDQTTTTPNVTTPEITTPETTTVPPGSHIPEMDFDGADFRISARGIKEIFVNEESTDIYEIAADRRNKEIMDEFNIRLERIQASSTIGAQVGELLNMALSDVDYCELAMPFCMDSTSLIINGVVKNWKNFRYTDLSQPYWMSDFNDLYTIQGNIYTTVGYSCTSTVVFTYGVFYNRTKGEAMNADLSGQIFDTIRNGDWTYDYFYDIVSNVYDDIDDINGRSAGDFYGLVAEANTNVDNYHQAWDIPVITNDPETGFNLDNYFTEKLVSAVDMIDALYSANGSYIPENAFEPITRFVDGKALFTTTFLEKCFFEFRDMTDDYTILPYPKYDENQLEYRTGVMDNMSVITVPITAKDDDMISVIAEVLNFYSWRDTYYVKRDDCLKGKYARDPETVEMLGILFDGLTSDPAFLISRTVRAPYLMREVIRGYYKDIRTAWDTNAENYNEQIKLFMDKYKAWANS